MNENAPEQKKEVIYAKGLKGVIATETGLSDVRGAEGHLLYCGYEIEDLVDLCSFAEIIYLLLNKRLPNREELEGLQQRLRNDRELPPLFLHLYRWLHNVPQPIHTLL